MCRICVATFVISILGANLVAQSPAPTSPAVAPEEKASQPAQTPPTLATPSPAAAPTVEELVNSLGPADLQAFITLLKGNFTDQDAITDNELNRATVQGLLVRLPRGITLLTSKESGPSLMPGALYSEVIAGRTGYIRLGSLNN